MKIIKIDTTEQLTSAFYIRKEVFVKEQQVPLEMEFDEYDNLDSHCKHILAYHEDHAVATGRIRVVDNVGKLERICILIPFRKLGIGKGLIATLEKMAQEQGLAAVKLHGQTQAQGFYEQLGYQVASEEFMEDGIPHVLMTKKLV